MSQYALLIIAFIFGTAIGSFLNVVIWRLPRGQSLGGRSVCPHCSYTLGAKNLVPLLSYLGQGRRCANCRKPISPRYFLIELLTGFLFALALYFLGPITWNLLTVVTLLRLGFIISILIVVFVIDLEHYLILDKIVLPGAAVILISNLLLDTLAHRSILTFGSATSSGLVAALLASGFFYLIWRISHGRWMGFGDVKYNLFLGLTLGLAGIAAALFLAFMLGSIIGVALILLGRKNMQSRVPFGTFLSAAALVSLFYGPALAAWYAQLIGWR